MIDDQARNATDPEKQSKQKEKIILSTNNFSNQVIQASLSAYFHRYFLHGIVLNIKHIGMKFNTNIIVSTTFELKIDYVQHEVCEEYF